MLIFILILITYLTVGALYSRRRYATISFENEAKRELYPNGEVEKVNLRKKQLQSNIDMLTNKTRNGVNHTQGCGSAGWSIPEYNRKYCTCGVYKKVNSYSTELREIELGEVNGSIPKFETPSVFAPMLAWPGYMIGNFITSGTPADTDRVRQIKDLQQARHDAELAELRAREAEALDRELALARKR